MDEVAKRWGETPAYKEYLEKTKGHSSEKMQGLTDGLNGIMVKAQQNS